MEGTAEALVECLEVETDGDDGAQVHEMEIEPKEAGGEDEHELESKEKRVLLTEEVG